VSELLHAMPTGAEVLHAVDGRAVAIVVILLCLAGVAVVLAISPDVDRLADPDTPHESDRGEFAPAACVGGSMTALLAVETVQGKGPGGLAVLAGIVVAVAVAVALAPKRPK
jgi:hypothetical protein